MKNFLSNTYKFFLAIAIMAAVAGIQARPNQTAAAACLPNITINLWAKTGSVNLGGITQANIWGFSDTAGGAATLPGPVIAVNQHDCVKVSVTNSLTESIALDFSGQQMAPDLAGINPGSTKDYIFTADNPGTFLYQTGLLPGSQHQVAMGLYGALVVNSSTPNQAYGTTATAYGKSVPVVLSEVDPALNSKADPKNFDMRGFAPKFFLVNGQVYSVPFNNEIYVDAGSAVLLRFVNAGLQSHAMSILGLTQTVIAVDGSPFLHPHGMASETIAPGQTLDVLVQIPASAAVGTLYPLYDANLNLRNSGQTGLGGMLTFLRVGVQPPPPILPDTTGPAVAQLSLTNNPTNGTVAVGVNATLDETATGGANVAAAEFYIDSTAATANAMSGSFGTIMVSASGQISTATLASLSSGSHTIYVRGQDSLGNWGSFRAVSLSLDKSGPNMTSLSLSPNPSSGQVSVTLNASASDATKGGSLVNAAEYWVDAGSPAAMTLVGTAGIASSFTASIPAGLSMGAHKVYVHSRDNLGNWGPVSTIVLNVLDTLPPASTVTNISPNPNNGKWGLNSSTPAVRVSASFSDQAAGGSNIAAAEGFVDVIGTTGSGFVFVPADGNFNSAAEAGYADIPLAVIGTLSEGNHTIYVHARDAAGNWGSPSASTGTLVIKKSLYFSTVGNTNPPGVSGSADDADIYLWNGTAFSRSVDISAAPYTAPSAANIDGFDRVDATHFYVSFSADITLPGGLSVQDEDIVYYNNGVWSVYFDGTAHGLTANNLDIDAFSIQNGVIYFSTTGNTNPPGVTGTADDADIYAWNGTAFNRVVDMSALGVPSGANLDGLVWVDATHFYFSLTADSTLPGGLSVQDEDILYYNAGAWLVYFDGTAAGLTANNQDIDAFDIP